MTMRSKVFTYQALLHWRGGHAASVTSADRPELTVTPPPEFPDGRGDHWSPEHLFLAALESCTMLSFLAHCEHNDLEVGEYSAAATGSVERRSEDQRYAFTHVSVVVSVRMATGHAQAARELTPKAERDCYITASTTARIETEWRIIE